jgi:hypothetical protein
MVRDIVADKPATGNGWAGMWRGKPADIVVLLADDCPTGKSPQDMGQSIGAKILPLPRRANQP